MSNIAGVLLETGFQLNGETGLTPALTEGLPNIFPADVLPPFVPLPIAGAVAIAAPIDILPQAEFAGAIVPSIGDLFFNRIHVLPNVINVGNLANKQTRQIEIFNAYIEETQTLETVAENGNLSGVAFDLEPPQVFAPFGSKFFTITINAAGAPAFNGFYSFTFDNATAPDLSVLGQRIIPFVFPHNWNALPVEAVEYLTKVYETRADYETAVKFRAFPRRRLKYRHTVIENADPKQIAEARAELESAIYSWMHRPFALPIWEDCLFLSSFLSADATEINCNPVGLDFDAGGYILFWKNSKDFELIEITEVLSNKIKFKRATERDWTGATLVLPARLARLADSVDFVGETEDILEFSTEWIVEPDQRSINRIGTFTAPTYRGFPIWLAAYRFADTIERSLNRKQTIIDFGIGARAVLPTGANPRGNFPAAVINMNRQEIAAFYGFLDQRAGKLNPCWFPSWANDAQLLDTAGETATSITVAGNRFSNVYAADPSADSNRRDLMIRWKDDFKFYVRVLSATAVNSEKENLFLSAPLPRILTPANIDRISFLRFARLEADRVELTKETTNVSRAEFICRELVAAE